MSVIKVTNVHKKFKVYYDKGQSLKERILFKNRNYYEDRWVLKGVSFQVEKGEAVGLIGENGCGKSTLLKLMTKIMYPDKGSIEIEGRISSLIELGAGFHPDMSGRENIYTNAAIFGLSRSEIDKRIKEIIQFSELEEFIDNPVRTFSSGMYMRLAFAVAINVDADVLLIDEILAVGDAAFQSKCFNKLREIKASGTTIVIVSHSLGQIEQICEKSYWLDAGNIRLEGTPRDVHPYYLDFMGNRNKTVSDAQTDSNKAPDQIESVKHELIEANPSSDQKRWGDQSVCIKNVKLYSSDGEEKYIFKTGDSFNIEITYSKINESIQCAETGIGIIRTDGLNCYGTNTQMDMVLKEPLLLEGRIICHIDSISLLPSEYYLDVAFHKDDGFPYDYWKECLKFRIYSEIQDVGVARQFHQWEFK